MNKNQKTIVTRQNSNLDAAAIVNNMLAPRAVKILNLLKDALVECQEHQTSVVIGDNEMSEAINNIESAIGLIISTEITKIHNPVANQYLKELE